MAYNLTGKSIQQLRLSTDGTGSSVKVILAKKSDVNSRFIHAILFDSYGEIGVSGTSVQLNATLPNGTTKVSYGQIINNKAYVKIAGNMLATVGKISCDITLTGTESKYTSCTSSTSGALHIVADSATPDEGEIKLSLASVNSDESLAVGDYVVLSDVPYVLTSETFYVLVRETNYNDSASLGEDVTTLAQWVRSQIGSMEGRITIIETDISSLKTRMTTAETDVSSLKTRMTTAETNRTNDSARISSLESGLPVGISKTASGSIYLVNSSGTQIGEALQIGSSIDGFITELNDEGETVLYLAFGGVAVGEGITINSIGGGGSGSGSSGSTVKITNKMSSRSWTITTATLNNASAYNISYNCVSLDSETSEATGYLSTAWTVNNVKVATQTNVAQGDQTFNIKSYLTSGVENTVKLTVTDALGTSKSFVWYITVSSLSVSWNLSSVQVCGSSSLTVLLTPTGVGSKTMHLAVDGTEIYTQATTVSGRTFNTIIPAKTHGVHTVTAWVTATIEGESVSSDILTSKCIWVTTTTPIVTMLNSSATVMQAISNNFQYFVYDPQNEQATVTLKINGTTSKTLTVGRTVQLWEYKATSVTQSGSPNVLRVECGSSYDTMNVTVTALDIPVSEVSNACLVVDPSGHSNSEANIKTNFGYTASASEYRLTADTTIDSSKTYYTRSGSTGNYTYTAVETPNVSNIATYYENTANHPFTYSSNFDWVNGGFQSDDDGVTAFVIKKGTYVTLDRSFFDDNAKNTGKEIKIIFKTKNVRNYDAEIMNCLTTADGIGLKLQAQQATLGCSTNTLVSYYCEDKKIELDVNIDSYTANATNLAMVWLSGVPSRTFEYSNETSWQQGTAKNVQIGSDDADVWIYKIKMYSRSLTRPEVVDNYIADCADGEEMYARYNRNNIYATDGTSIDINKLANNNQSLRIIEIRADRITTGKKDKVTCKVIHTIRGLGDTHNFTAEGVKMKAQGTSSLAYGAAALNLDLDFSEVTSWKDNANTTMSSYAMTSNSIGVNYFTIKLNVASSENANNVCLADDYNTYQPYVTGARQSNSKVRDTIEGHPCVVFFTNTSSSTITVSSHTVAPGETILYGCGDMCNSKSNIAVFGHEDEDHPLQCCIEITNNNNDQCLFKSDDLTDEGWGENDGDSFEPRYPDELTSEMKSKFQEMLSWVVSTNINADKFFGTGVSHSYTDALTTEQQNATKTWTYNGYVRSYSGATGAKLVVADDYSGSETDIITLTEARSVLSSAVQTGWYIRKLEISSGDTANFTCDTPEYRAAKFYNEVSTYFAVDSLTYHYLFTERHCMIDNRAKNTFVSYEWDSTKNKYLWNFNKDYDNDTGEGNDNSGGLTFTYGLEDTDEVEGRKAFNASDSVLWCNVRDVLSGKLKTMYTNRESAGAWNSTRIINKFKTYQGARPEALVAEDMYTKYIDPGTAVIGGEGTTRYYTIMLGTKEDQRMQFEIYQEKYMASKYDGSLATSTDRFEFRPQVNASTGGIAVSGNMKLKPYSNMYLTVKYGESATVRIRATRNTEYTVSCPVSGNNLSDIETYVYLASNITEIKDLAGLYTRLAETSTAKKMQKFILGSSNSGYQNTALESLTLANNNMLEYIDIRGVKGTSNFSSSLDLSNLNSLKEFYATNSGITGVKFANNAPVEKVTLPLIRSLTARNLTKLTQFDLTGTNLTYLWLEGTPFINSYNLVSAATNLQRGRITNVSWSNASVDLLLRLASLRGIDAQGNEIDTFVLTGSASVTDIAQDELTTIQTAFPNLTLTYTNIVPKYTITFVDESGNTCYTERVKSGSYPLNPTSQSDFVAPTKANTVEHSYTFSGTWTPSFVVATQDATYTAVFTSSVQKYNVIFTDTISNTTNTYETNYGSTCNHTYDWTNVLVGDNATKYFTHWTDQYGNTYTSNAITLSASNCFINSTTNLPQSINLTSHFEDSSPSKPSERKSSFSDYTWQEIKWLSNAISGHYTEVSATSSYVTSTSYDTSAGSYTINMSDGIQFVVALNDTKDLLLTDGTTMTMVVSGFLKDVDASNNQCGITFTTKDLYKTVTKQHYSSDHALNNYKLAGSSVTVNSNSYSYTHNSDDSSIELEAVGDTALASIVVTDASSNVTTYYFNGTTGTNDETNTYYTFTTSDDVSAGASSTWNGLTLNGTNSSIPNNCNATKVICRTGEFTMLYAGSKISIPVSNGCTVVVNGYHSWNMGGYKNSILRTYLTTTMQGILPQNVAVNAVSVKKDSTIGGKSSITEYFYEKVWAMSNTEVSGSTAYPIYTDNNSRIKKYTNGTGSADYWWLRSPGTGNNYFFWRVYYDGGVYSGSYYANFSHAVAFGFAF